MRAPINKVIPFSSVDGPGNRTAIFLQGCNFNCQYCHNPETIHACIHCGACVETCPTDALKVINGKVSFLADRCCACDTCIKNCPHGSSPRILYLNEYETFQKIQNQMPFIRGVTVSGGECMLHAAFLEKLFVLCKKAGLHTLLDSNGSIKYADYKELMAVTDGVMLDVKAWNEEEHKTVTGISNKQVLENLVWLAKQGKLQEVRTVVVPGLFDYEGTIKAVATALQPYLSQKSIRYKLIAYRAIGVREEYKKYQSPDETQMQALEQQVRAMGFDDVVVI